MSIEVLAPLDVRIPKWNYNSLSVRTCPFCGGKNDALFKRPDKLPIAFCRICGCWYVANLPSVPDLIEFYNTYYHAHRPTDLSAKGVSRIIENARNSSKTNWQFHALSKLCAGKGRMRILDVGCGYGRFLLEAKLMGADVVGCDLSPEACAFADKNFGIKVYQSELHSCLSEIGEADVVVMRDFIEHPVWPMLQIEAAISILKPGGLLFFHTPNGGEAGNDIETAKKWVGFRVDLEHLQYLSSHTINWLSEKCNMRIERLETSGFPGLKGIAKLPKKRSTICHDVKEKIKTIPGLRKIAKTFSRLKAQIMNEKRDLRLGSYHLFAILRKE